MVTDDGDNNRGLHGVDREGTLVGRDGVVVGVGALIQRVAERVGGRAGVGLGTSDAVGRTLAHDKAVAGDGDLVLDQSRAVVGLGSGGRRQRDGALLDGHGTVFNDLEGHVGEVLVNVRELPSGQAHGRGTRIGALGARRTLEGKVDTRLSTIQVGGDTVDSDALDAVASRNVLSTVVQLGILVTLDLDNDSLLVRGHLKSALGLGDGVVVGVSALVQLIGEGVVALAHHGLKTSNAVGCTLALDKAVAGDGDLIVGQSRTVVGLGSISGCQGDRARLNRKLARLGLDLKLRGHVVTRRVSHLGGAVDKVDMLAGVRALNHSSQAGNGVLDAVDCKLVGHNAGSSMLLTVVGVGSGDGLNLNLILRAAVGNGERAGGLRQVVVLIEVCTSHRRDGLDGAPTRANLNLLAAIRAALDALAIGEGTRDDLEICCDERGTVVLLVSFRRLDGHIALGDRQLAVDGGHLKLGGNVVTGRILDNRRARDVVDVVIGFDVGVRALGIRSRETLDREREAVGEDGCGLKALGRMDVAVIGGAGGVGGNGDLVLLCTVLDREGAVSLGNGVVLSLRVAVQRVGEGVGGATHSRLSAGKDVRGPLAISPTVTRNLDRCGAVDERSAVVLLGKICRLESDRALSNSKRTIGHIKTNAGAGEVIRNAVRKRKARASKSHGVGANIGASRLGSHVGAQDNLISLDQTGADGLNRKALNGLLTAVIRLGVRGALDLNDDLISIGSNEKAAILDLSDNVLACSIYRANCTLSKYCTIGTSIRTSSTNGDSREIGTLGRAGKARHALLRAVIRLGVGIRGQGHVLVVVDVDNAGTIALDRDGRTLIAHGGVAVNKLGAISRADNAIPRSRLRFRIGNLVLSTIEVVVHRVVDGILLIEEDSVVTLDNRMRAFSRANQVVAVNCLGRVGDLLAQLAVARVGVGKLRAGTVLLILDLVRNEFLPSGLKGHITGRHDEGVTAGKGGDIIQARNGPTSELVVLTRGLMPHGLGRTLRSGIHGSVGAAPRAAVQVINNLVTANILGIEVRRVIHRVWERRRLCERLIEIPARERIGNAVHVLGFRERIRGYIGRLGLRTSRVVLRANLTELGAARITQVVLNKNDTLALDGNVAVQVYGICAAVVLRDFCRNKRNLLDIILGKRNARKLCLDNRPIVLINLIPGSGTPLHHVGTIRPRNHALVDIVEAVLIIDPRRIGDVHLRGAVRICTPRRSII